METEPNVYVGSFLAILVRVFLPLFCIFMTACSTASYVLEASVGQWKLFNRQRPIEDVLKSPYTNEKTKAAIKQVQIAKKFAASELGLKATNNYSSFVQLDDDFVSWAVQAADPLLLEQKKWKFPIVGEVPYLGFFSEKRANEYADEMLKKEELDLWVRGVPAFSSLGWFNDPLYSSMIHGNEREIAELVIHESLHATLWVGDSVDFNEQLANFVGVEGSVRYLQFYYPENLAVLEEARGILAGEKIFGEFIQSSIERYKKEVSTKEEKQKFYGSLEKSFETFFDKSSKGKSPRPKRIAPKFTNWNNAALLSFSNYYADYSIFEKLLQKCDGDLKRFVNWLVLQKEKGRHNSAPEEFLTFILEQTCPKI